VLNWIPGSQTWCRAFLTLHSAALMNLLASSDIHEGNLGSCDVTHVQQQCHVMMMPYSPAAPCGMGWYMCTLMAQCSLSVLMRACSSVLVDCICG
jgi:hypothetical protein